jgi:CheY-like chemotaxis protein
LLTDARNHGEGGFMSELQTVETANLPTATPARAALPLVLIADANPVSRRRRVRELEDRGYRVAAARTSFETIVKASCYLPDLILVGASLGAEHAHETTELLSTCPATAHIPILHVAAGRRLPARLDVSPR